MEQATKRKLAKQVPAFVVGLILGVAGALLVPELFTDHFEGTVTGKKRLRDRLMVMIHMKDHGEVIATFTEKIGQIDFLIRPGDTVALGLVKYEVLVDNPLLTMVKRVGGEEIVGNETFEATAESGSATSLLRGTSDDVETLEPPAAGDSADGEPAAGEPANGVAPPPGGDARPALGE